MKKIELSAPTSTSGNGLSESIGQLMDLFPDAFVEGKVDFGVLRQLLGGAVDESEEKFGLNWHGKRLARQLALTPSRGTLRPVPSESVCWESTQNLMIEGDNLEVLKLLQKSYSRKIKLIYIDPPYNTGKDFIYQDNYQDSLATYLALTEQVDEQGRRTSSNSESTGRLHTDWLNMLYPRMKIARNLLRNDGLIVVSIDQVELANLKYVMDEIFGSENFFAVLTRRAMHTVRNSSKDFNLHADYLLCYGRQKAWFGEQKSRYIRAPADKSDDYKNDDHDGRGPYKLDPLSARNYYTPYEHQFANGVTWSPPSGSFPRYSQSTLTQMEQEGRIDFGKGQPMAKRYLREVQDGIPPNTILDPSDVGFNLDGTKELRSVLGEDKVFPQPKPTKLVRYLLKLCADPEAIVLDFFAGSGTTAHAVWQENLADQGNRTFILVQIPELIDTTGVGGDAAIKFCDQIEKPRKITEITKERLRRTRRALKTQNPDFVGDFGFRVFRLDTSNLRAWNPLPDDLESALLEEQERTEEGRTELDIFYELLLKLGLDLCSPIETRVIKGKNVYKVGAGALMACLDDLISQNDVETLGSEIADWHDSFHTEVNTTIVFRDSAFADDVTKVNLTAILEQRQLKHVRSL